MSDWFQFTDSDDPIEIFAYRALSYGLLLFVTGALLMISLGGGQRLYVGLSLLALFATCFALLRQQRLTLSAQLFTIGLWLLVTGTVIVHNGINNTFIFTYALILVYSTLLLLPRYWLYLMSGLTAITLILLTIGEWQGIVPLTTQPPILIDRMIITVMVIGGISLLLILSVGVLQRSITQLQVSERKLAERNHELENVAQQLLLSEERYRLLFESMTVPCIVYDEAGTFLLLNQATADVIGQPVEAVIGQNLLDIVVDGKKLIEENRQVFESGQPMFFEDDYRITGDAPHVFRRHIFPLPDDADETGGIKRVLTITADITGLMEAQERMQELAIAQAKVAFYSDFFGTVSHDIKNPLTVINTSLYLLERSSTQQQREHKVAQIKYQVTVIEKYIQDMLMISRLEHIPTFNKTTIQLSPLFNDLIKQSRPRLERKSQVCTLAIDQNLTLMADNDQLTRALGNLIENAINYTPDGGTIEIIATRAADRLYIQIKDSGMGIPEDDIPHIFERFYRASAAKSTMTNGTGLGLAIVKKVIDLHDGEITVESVVGDGTTFHVYFPALPGDYKLPANKLLPVDSV